MSNLLNGLDEERRKEVNAGDEVVKLYALAPVEVTFLDLPEMDLTNFELHFHDLRGRFMVHVRAPLCFRGGTFVFHHCKMESCFDIAGGGLVPRSNIKVEESEIIYTMFKFFDERAA